MGATRCHGHQCYESDLAQNLMQPFLHLNDGSDKISLRLAHWLRRYSSLKMFTHRHTDTQTTARLVYYKLIFEPSAQVSLKPALYLSGAKIWCFCMIRDFGSPSSRYKVFQVGSLIDDIVSSRSEMQLHH